TGYVAERRFFGATIGRYANRIANAQFSLDGQPIQLAANNGPNSLHGGLNGFDRVLWDIVDVTNGAEPAVSLAHVSEHGDEGFCGRLEVRVSYRITGTSELSVSFEATTDRPTIVNLTNHSFFNLEGATSGVSVLDHRLMLTAERFLAI